MSIVEHGTRDNFPPEYAGFNSRDLFMAELKSPAYNRLTPNQERALLLQLKDPNPEVKQRAKDRLTEANLGLVINLARRYTPIGRHLGFELDDLIGEGTDGLMKAIKYFNPDKGQRLSTYATKWINKVLGRALENGGTIKHPVNKIEECRRFKKVQAALCQKLQRQPTVLELAQELAFEPDKTQGLLDLVNRGERKVASLDETPRSIDTSVNKVDSLIDSNANPERDVLRKETLEKCLALFDKLPDQERKVMREVVVLVLNGYKMGSVSSPIQPTIAKEMGVTRQRVDQIMKKALERLLTDPLLKEETAEVIDLLRS